MDKQSFDAAGQTLRSAAAAPAKLAGKAVQKSTRAQPKKRPNRQP
jgi:hypothetical protein